MKENQLLGGNDLTRAVPESGQPERTEFFEVGIPSLSAPFRIGYAAIRDLKIGADANGERMGLLLGSSSSQAIAIRRFEPLSLLPATRNDSRSRQRAFLQLIKARLQTPLGDAPEVLGCFRTQPSGWPEMTESDVETARRNFPGLETLFLVIRTTQHRPWLAALYSVSDQTASASTAPVLEFPLDEYLLRRGYVTEFVEPSEPNDASVPANQTRWIVGAVFFVVLLAGSGATYRYMAGSPAATEQNEPRSGPLSLRAVRRGKDFELSWDRLSAAVRGTSGGTLTIQDGMLTRSVPLSGAQLREGHILYAPLFDELTFRLEIGTPDKGGIAESVQALVWSRRQPADSATVAPSGSSVVPPFVDRRDAARSPSPGKPLVPLPVSPKKDSGTSTETITVNPAPLSAPGKSGKHSTPRTQAIPGTSLPPVPVAPANPK